MKAQDLLEFLLELEEGGSDLSKIEVYYRYDSDSDVELINFVEEDLFDEETNSVLTSIVIKTEL